jgi:hypothetical protein
LLGKINIEWGGALMIPPKQNDRFGKLSQKARPRKKKLYTYYFYYFIVGGFVLLIAMIGAIVLTLPGKNRQNRQSVAQEKKMPKEKGQLVYEQISHIGTLQMFQSGKLEKSAKLLIR